MPKSAGSGCPSGECSCRGGTMHNGLRTRLDVIVERNGRRATAEDLADYRHACKIQKAIMIENEQ